MARTRSALSQAVDAVPVDTRAAKRQKVESSIPPVQSPKNKAAGTKQSTVSRPVRRSARTAGQSTDLVNTASPESSPHPTGSSTAEPVTEDTGDNAAETSVTEVTRHAEISETHTSTNLDENGPSSSRRLRGGRERPQRVEIPRPSSARTTRSSVPAKAQADEIHVKATRTEPSASTGPASRESEADDAKHERSPISEEPLRLPKRIKLTFSTKMPEPIIAHPMHRPKPREHESVRAFLDTFVSLDDDMTQEQAAEFKSAQEKVRSWARDHPDVLATANAAAAGGNDRLKASRATEPAVPPSHQDALLGHACNFSKLMQEERKRNLATGRRIAAMVQKYWRNKALAGEREAKESERNLRQLAKRTSIEVRRKWKLAEKDVHKRYLEMLEEQKRQASKEQLKDLLDRSTTLLDARRLQQLEDDSSDASSRVSDDDEDRYLSVDQLRAKYAAMPDLEISEDNESDDDDNDDDDEEATSDTDEIGGGGEEEEEEEEAAGEDEDGDQSDAARSPRADVDPPAESAPVVEQVNGRRSTRSALKSELEAEIESLPEQSDDASEDDSSAMDSELDENEDDESSTSVEGPGLAWLYPELAKGPTLATAPHSGVESPSETTDYAKGSRRRGNQSDLQSLPDDSQADEEQDDDDNPMDSELDEDSDEGADGAAADEGPGLAWLYPELAKAKSSGLQKIEPVAQAERPTSSRTRASTADLQSLPDDSEEEAEDDDDEPMDSELDETSNNEDEDASDASEGPGLAWLYQTPMQKPKIEEITAETANEDHEVDQLDQQKKVDDTASDAEQAVTSAALDLSHPLGAEEIVGDEKRQIKLQQPALLRGKLREYQHAGMEWLAGLNLNGTNGILADEMGLGKTIQTISLLTWLACEQELWGPHLIVVPTSVMLNWEMEFKKFAPGLKVLTYYGSPKERKEKRKGWSKPDVFHVCITSYQLVLQDQQIFRRKRWAYMILDEAHNIKNFKSQRWQTLLNFNTQNRLLLTGTPLQNNLNELWSLLYFLMPQGIAEDAAFANLADFQEWFGRPVDKLVEQAGSTAQDEQARETVGKLHRILRPYILRRLKADVEQQMPGKYEHIVPCRLSKRQRFLYDDFMSRAQTRETLASGNFLSIINCFMQLRKVCNHPDLFESRPIVTSLAFERSAVAVYEPRELLIRRRLLRTTDNNRSALATLNLVNVINGQMSSLAAESARQLIEELPSVPEKPISKSEVSNLRQWKASVLVQKRQSELNARHKHFNYLNDLRISRRSVYSTECLAAVTRPSHRWQYNKGQLPEGHWLRANAIDALTPTMARYSSSMETTVRKFACITPTVKYLDMASRHVPLPLESQQQLRHEYTDPGYVSRTCTSIAFPDKRLLQYDCGKLQRLDALLRDLIPKGHRCLIFTQMTRMLDVLEQFLNIHGHRYFRLDGATKVDTRQLLTERFNRDTRIPVFILSTRSGGLGINLTGADTVIFYDSDWNPSMDRQCQDRAHRIGQQRDVHIYRFVSDHTIEQNILKRARQKRLLDDVVIGDGAFTTDFLDNTDWRDMLGEEMQLAGVDVSDVSPTTHQRANPTTGPRALESALAAAEDDDDVAAARQARSELQLDDAEFDVRGAATSANSVSAEQVTSRPAGPDDGIEGEDLHVDKDGFFGHIDDYMVGFVEREVYGM
ncbi:swr1 complex component [Savitreella phatthalungensis]